MNPCPCGYCRRRASGMPLLAGAHRPVLTRACRGRCGIGWISSSTCRRVPATALDEPRGARTRPAVYSAGRRRAGDAVAALARAGRDAQRGAGRPRCRASLAVRTRDGRRLLTQAVQTFGLSARGHARRAEGGAHDCGSRGVGSGRGRPRRRSVALPIGAVTGWVRRVVVSHAGSRVRSTSRAAVRGVGAHARCRDRDRYDDVVSVGTACHGHADGRGRGSRAR